MVKVTPNPKPRAVRHFLREWRKYRRLTQQQLADRIDSTASAISQLENGLINYTQPTLEALAVALSCDPGDILVHNPFIEDAIYELNKILRLASTPDRERAMRVIREMLKTGTEG